MIDDKIGKKYFVDNSRAKHLIDLLSESAMSIDQAEAVAHAFVDIADSIDKIYIELLPALLARKGESLERLKEAIWEIREEFRHIEYHIQDAKLLEL